MDNIKIQSTQPRAFHLIGLVHLPVSKEYMGCAFTQKVYNMAKMLMSLGHTVYLYGAESSDAPCTEFIQTHTMRDIRQEWGDGDNRFDIGYNWKEQFFRHDFNDERTATTLNFYQVALNEILKRKAPNDFILLMQGVYQKPISDAADLWLTCEPGVGYRGSFCRFRAFESSYLQNFTYGSEHPKESINGHFYDRVIPNYFDEDDFVYNPGNRSDYFFYIGRLIERKGVRVAMKTCNAIGAKLVIAGQGDPSIFGSDGEGHEFIGYVDSKERTKLMSKAKAVFVPTLYLEAFGGVNVEAQLCGTPVITTDFGVFPETVRHGVTGFRCNTLQDFVDAAKGSYNINPENVRKHAERYLMKNVRHEFEKWFQDLYQLYLSAQDSSVKGWHYLE